MIEAQHYTPPPEVPAEVREANRVDQSGLIVDENGNLFLPIVVNDFQPTDQPPVKASNFPDKCQMEITVGPLPSEGFLLPDDRSHNLPWVSYAVSSGQCNTSALFQVFDSLEVLAIHASYAINCRFNYREASCTSQLGPGTYFVNVILDPVRTGTATIRSFERSTDPQQVWEANGSVYTPNHHTHLPMVGLYRIPGAAGGGEQVEQEATSFRELTSRE